jgi:replicative DNA helicase
MLRSTDAPALTLVRRVDVDAHGPTTDTVPTGFPSVDQLLGGGMRRGDLVVVGGDAASGKSAFVLAVAMRAAAHSCPAVVLSSEMTGERLTERALAMEARVRIDDLRRGALDDAARARVSAAALRLRDLPLALRGLRVEEDPAGPSLATHVTERALLVVDPLQALAAGTRPLDEELSHAVRRLKALAVEHQVAVLATAHVPGLGNTRRDRRALLDDFGVLGAVKQFADVVCVVHREEMFSEERGLDGATELIVRKNRNGPTGFADLYFHKQWMRFEDMLDPEG